MAMFLRRNLAAVRFLLGAGRDGPRQALRGARAYCTPSAEEGKCSNAGWWSTWFLSISLLIGAIKLSRDQDLKRAQEIRKTYDKRWKWDREDDVHVKENIKSGPES